jgi:spermidine synthase
MDWFGSGQISLLEFLVLATYLMFPISFLSGVIFTFLGQFLKQTVSNPIKAAGYVTLSNTTGAAVGSLAAGLVILPVFGIEIGLFLLASGYAIASLIIPAKKKDGVHSRAKFVFKIVFVLALIYFPYTLMKQGPTKLLASHIPGHELIELREGLTETARYYVRKKYKKPFYYRLVTNSHSMSATNIMAQRYMKLYVYLPMALNPEIRSALLISYGVGSTAKALTNSKQIDSIDIVDISKDILEMNSNVYADNELPVLDPRVTAHIEDGRFFLNTVKKKYDLITSEPPPPKMSGIVNLYSEEYFELILKRLNIGGYLTYWLPAHGMNEDEALSIIKAFCNVFDDCSLWAAARLDWMLVGSNQGVIDAKPESLYKQWKDKTVAADLKNIGLETPEQMGALYIGGPGYLKKLTTSALPLTDNYPLRLSPVIDSMPTKYSPVYAGIMNEENAFARYIQSPFANRFSADTRMMEPYYQYQKYLKSLKLPAYAQKDSYRWEDLKTVLQSSNLQTLPLWMMLSDWRTQEIVEEVKNEQPTTTGIHLEIARKQIAQRDYQNAIDSLAFHMEEKNWNFSEEEFCLYLFALALDEKVDTAKILIQMTPAAFKDTPTISRFLTWYSKQFLTP